MAQVTCRFCKQKIDKDNAYSPSAKMYYCNKDHYQKQLDKDKYKPNKTKANGEPNDRRLLTDFIMNEYINAGIDKHEINWKLITANLKNLMDENKDMKYSGILYCLKYMKEIRGINLISEESNTPLALMPFYYNESKNYWIETDTIKKEIENFDFNDEIKVIKKVDKKDKMRYNQIRIEDLI